MKRLELDNLIKNGDLPKNFIFFGESHFLIEHYIKKISDIEDANILTLYHDEYNFSIAKSHISQASLFGGKNVLIIKNDKKIPKKELEQLFEISNKGDNIVLFGYFGDDYKIYASGFKNLNVASVRFFHPRLNESLSIIENIAIDKGLKIDRYIISHLFELQNHNLELTINELDKLTIYKDKELTIKDVDSLVYGMGEIGLNDFLKKLALKEDITDGLQNLLEHGEDEVRILNSIASFFTELNLFNIYIRDNGVVNPKDILGYIPPKFVVDEKANLSMRIKPNQYKKIFEALIDAELDIKLYKGDKSSVLYSVIFKILQILRG